ncbi:structure-specific endonuclease subunit SLX4-like isoform X2 [Haliotis rufescens]|uniref:structure-specific endonuclease subunit SLX4-like isoform X2 n=1 Tax=Haliotis rufescens TaxID=6454 RepID=UPI00201F1573|nr:structure-specific endonuclease subunit SLX4-like isoform X2 [Haliotis rufescens]
MEKTKEGRQSGSSVEEDGGSTDSAAAAARSLGMKAAKKGKLSLQRPNAADGKLRMPATSGADLDETGDFKDGHMFCMTSVLRKHSRATSSSKHGDGAALSRQRHGASSSKHTDGASRSKHTDGAGSSKHTDGAGSSKHTDGAGSSKHSDGAGSSKHSDGAGSSKHSDGAGSSKHSDGAGSSKHSDGAGSSKHSDGAGSSKHSDGAGSSKHSDGAVSNKNSGSDLLVVARKKKTVESRREKMSEMNRAEEDEGRNRTVKTVGDIDGKQQPAKSGKAGDADGTVEEVGAGVVSAGSGGVVSAGAGGVVSAGAAGPNVRSCPTCKHLMADRVFKDHIKECLQQFHIRTKDRRRRVEVMFALEDEKIKRRRNRFLVKENGGDVVTDDDYFLCQICQKDLSHMNSQRRTQHMNRCIDEAEMKEDKLEVEQQSGKSAQSIVLDCPMCGKPLKTESSRKVHLKQCARMLNVKTGMMLQAVKAQEDEHQVKMAAGITQQASREVPRKKTAAGAPGKKLTKKKAKGPMDEDTQLAMALSSSLAEEETKKEQALIGQLNLRGIANIAQKDRKEAKKTRKKKDQQGLPPPLLLQLSKTEAQQRIADKVTQLIVPQVSLDEPHSTPPTVNSRLPDLPGTKVFVMREENSQSISMLWRRTALQVDNTDGQDARSLYYTEALMPPVCVSDIVAGSKLKHVSQIPGRRRSEELEQSCQEGHTSQVAENITCTPTAMLLAELAAEAGDSSCDVKSDADGGEDDKVADGDEDKAAKDAVTPDASGFCPEELVHINKEACDEAMSALQRHYLNLVDQEQSSDVAIETRDHSVVHAHRLILSVRCPQLLKLTRRGDIVHLLNSSRDAVLAVMKFVYGGAICLQPSLISEVKALAQQLCVTDLTAFCDASQVLQQTDMQTVTQTDMKTNQAESRAHRLTSIDDICHDMFSDSDFDLDPQGEKGACKEGGGSKSDEDEWREVYCSQRQQLHRRLSLGDVVVKDDIEEVGDFGRHRGELDTVEYVEEEVGDGPALTGHSSAGPMHGADPGDRPAHNSIDRKSTRKPSKTDPHSGEEELFSDDEEVEMDLLLDTSVSDNDVPDIDVPTMRHNRTCDRRSKHPGPGSATDPGFESHEADEKHSHGSDDFEIIQSGSSSSEEGNSDGSQGQQGTREETVSRISQYVAMSPFRSPDKTEPSRCRYVAMSPVRSPDKIEPSRCRYVAMSPVRSPDKTEPSRKAGSAKRKRAPSDQELVASPILSKKTHPHSVTPQTKQSPKRLKMLTPDRVVSNPGKGQGHSDKKIKMSTTNPGVTKVKSDEHMKMSTPLDRSGQGHSVVEQDSLYITPIPNQRQRSTFMLETPALTNLSQGLSMDGDFVATPVGRIVHSHSGQEILVHLNGSYLAENQTDADKNESGMQNDDCSRVACPVVEKENTRSVDAETTAASGTDVESGRSRNNNYSGQNPHTKSSNGNQSSKSSGVNHKTLSPGKKSVDSSDSDLEIVGDNFQLLSQSSFSPKFPGKFSFKKISSQTRKLSRKRRPSLYPHCHGDNEEGRKLEADGRNSQEEEDKNVLMSAVGMVTDCGDAAEESARMHRSPNTDQQDVDDVVDDPGDVWDGWDDMDAACHIEPLCDADTEESPQKRNRSSPTTPGKKHYTHKRRISMDMIEKKKKVSLATPGTSAEHGHTTSGQTSDDEDSLPSPGRVEAGEATLDFELPDADSFLWNDDNVPDMAPSLQVEDNKGRQLQQAANFKTPVSARPTKSAKKLVPPSPFTPMPDYDTMNTPQLKQQVGKFGVRPVGKKRMVGLLKDIYHKTHQYETDSDFDPEKSSPQKSTDRPSKSSMTKVDAGDRPSKHSVAKVGAGDRPSKHSVAKVGAGDRPSKPSVAKVGAGDRYNNVSVSESSTSEEGSTQRSVTSSQESGFSDVPEESFMVADEEISASQQGNQPDLQQKLASFIRQRSDIHTKLMMYEPLELDWLKREIQDAGIKCPMQKLMDFLDEKCLTFTMKKMSKRNTNRRQPKRKKKVKLPAAAV